MKQQVATVRVALSTAYSTYTPHSCYYAETAVFLNSFPSSASSPFNNLPQQHMCLTQLVRVNSNYSDPLNYICSSKVHVLTFGSYDAHSSSANTPYTRFFECFSPPSPQHIRNTCCLSTSQMLRQTQNLRKENSLIFCLFKGRISPSHCSFAFPPPHTPI